MNGAYLHLLVNHLPVLGTLFGLGLGVYGLARRQPSVIRAALGVFVIAAVGAWAANWTGEDAEHVLEEAVPTVSEARMHEHEEMAEKAAWAGYALGALALLTLGLAWGGKELRRPLVLGTVALSVVVSGMMGYTAKLGGEIRHHTEIDYTASGAGSQPASERGAAPARDRD